MNQFGVLFRKEWRENLRNYKIFWIPIVFILFGILEPVTNYFLPQLLDSLGNLPEGAVIELPVPQPEEILQAVLGQYQLIGMAILILAYMGSIAGERKSGTATLLYVRPLSFRDYFLSKWLMAGITGVMSVWLGLLAAYYYIFLLFEQVEIISFLQFAGTYSVWILLVITIVLAASAAMPNAGMAAAVSLALVFFMQIADSLLGAYWTFSPMKIPAYAAQWLYGKPDMSDYWWTLALAIAFILALLFFGIWMAKRKASTAKV
ncbi:putative transmembrane protein YxlG [Planococcus massiliensis]|uniref:Putative transmembrane protein YxlG n=1 Tax=Planococcus massiliensis TaxID=1499687 RepID=A0A098EIN8_9BACL|nr:MULTISPECIES: ABC transporter permease subunit [Planococcus]MCJ1907917.1 ABC transporter permease [Planococcus ruber]CEG21672.1 putative transmembrane protein YxlG [Planococcus massiliensis]